MPDSKIPVKIGSRVKINLSKVRDRIPTSLADQLSSNEQGTVIGYKMTDGRGIGVVVQFKEGGKSWFFQEEIERR
tara:strand:+ start:2097 stop:2321 length:225 start_codon:yes stop_codon:yes gene_type:complete